MTFENLNLIEPILKALKEEGYSSPTPIQEQSIPVLLQGKDLLGCAQTGTGKTAAFSIPILQKLYKTDHRKGIKALILTPTRELAIQIGECFEAYGKYTGLKHTVIFGGVGQKPQTDALRNGVQILVATPGRLLDLITQGYISLKTLDFFVLDEADRMLDMGFYDDIMQICSFLPKERQTLLFSATMPPKIRQLARQILHEPEEVSIAISKPNESIRQSAYICYEPQKMGIINAIFSQGVKGKTIIFSSSKLKVKQLTTALRRRNYNARAMHSDLDQPQREEVMLDYKNGKIDILVATDIVSRGIDITDIVLVINYDVPHDPEDYIHRIGRTARANAEGEAITFVSVDDQDRFYRIEKFLEREVPKMPLPEGLGEAPEYDIMSLDRRSSRKGGRGRSGKNGRSSGNASGDRRKGNFRRSKSPAVITEHPERTSTDTHRHTGEGETASKKRNNNHRYNHRRRPSDNNNGSSTDTPSKTE